VHLLRVRVGVRVRDRVRDRVRGRVRVRVRVRGRGRGRVRDRRRAGVGHEPNPNLAELDNAHGRRPATPRAALRLVRGRAGLGSGAGSG